nr:hypothetical protein [Tanacetum cinerariifolium]
MTEVLRSFWRDDGSENSSLRVDGGISSSKLRAYPTDNLTLFPGFFPISLTGAASRWIKNKPAGSINTWEILKGKFLSKYCPPARTAKKMEEINNFQQEPDETLYQAWERFKELLVRCPQHY